MRPLPLESIRLLASGAAALSILPLPMRQIIALATTGSWFSHRQLMARATGAGRGARRGSIRVPNPVTCSSSVRRRGSVAACNSPPSSTALPLTRPPLVIAHGLFGSARNWSAIAKRLALHRRVIAVDMRNHGESPRSPEHGYAALAGDLAETIAGHGGRADVLGHSMGGKAAMVLALTAPAAVRRLIVADMAPVAYAHSQIG